MKSLFLILPFAALAAAPVLLPPRRGDADVARGKYLVNAMGCADCHTPLVPGPQGPVPDPAMAFAGHPQDLKLPPPPELPPGPWLVTVAATNTAWAGPWGVSYTSNLTPDDETGIGRWPVETFLAAMRTGKHLGVGREILPPMPARALGQLEEADLRAIFSYLKSLPPVRNHVPDPLPPAKKK